MSNKYKVISVIVVVGLLAASRLLKHPYNFTPVAAMALFSGCHIRKYWGSLIPLGAMLVSDYFIGFYDWQVMASVYVSIFLAFIMGRFLSAKVKWHSVILSAFGSSILFYLVTNFAVWAFFDWYPHTLNGLLNNYYLALPFFRNTLLGDLIYSAVLFGAFELVLLALKKKAQAGENISAMN